MQTISEIDTAQICLNGHIVNLSCKNNPKANTSHCPQCGEKTITACLHCSAPIRGAAYYKRALFATSAGVCSVPKLIESEYPVPAYCHNCGSPYPWTEELLKDADAIIDSFDELSNEQRKLLKERFPDLLTDNPRTISSALTFSKLINGLTSVGSAVGKGFLINLLEKHVPETIFTLMQLR